MACLYVANSSKQNHDFYYVPPEQKRYQPQMQVIPAGTQVLIYARDAPKVWIDSVIEHHAAYGMVEAAVAYRTKGFVGLCYSEDRPVKMDQIAQRIHDNDEALEAMGKQIRREAAVAVDNIAASRDVNNLVMEVQEVDSRGRDVDGFAESLVVERQGQPERGAARSAPGKKPRRR